ncbi:hypothetical protein, partial [Acidaminococcus sp.]|uniref:hypothetical protein n=1 Tax=Acidaminococcus sp. TaxID=1872103 RepID=UPI003AB35AED
IYDMAKMARRQTALLIHHPLPQASLFGGSPRLGQAERLSPLQGEKTKGKTQRQKSVTQKMVRQKNIRKAQN